MTIPWMSVALTKRFPSVEIQAAWEWSDRPQRTVALYGPSGCGKTTILRCLAGLHRLDQGHIQLHSERWNDTTQRRHVPPQFRRVGMLFQDYLLFPHLTVRQNISYGLREPSRPSSEVNRLLAQFQISDLANRYPSQISGGQQQRVALARVLASQPRLLCLDEPLSALDSPTRAELQTTLRDTLRGTGLPTFVVTHDPLEAQLLADDVMVMSHGQVVQTGAILDVWLQPASATVARIVGYENVLTLHRLLSLDSLTATQRRTLAMAAQTGVEPNVNQTALCIRADDLRVRSPIDLAGVDVVEAVVETAGRGDEAGVRAGESELSAFVLAGLITAIVPEGNRWRLRIEIAPNLSLTATINRDTQQRHRFATQCRCQIELPKDRLVLVPDC